MHVSILGLVHITASPAKKNTALLLVHLRVSHIQPRPPIEAVDLFYLLTLSCLNFCCFLDWSPTTFWRQEYPCHPVARIFPRRVCKQSNLRQQYALLQQPFSNCAANLPQCVQRSGV